MSLPHETLVLWVHWRVLLTLKGVGEIRTVNQRSNHPVNKGENHVIIMITYIYTFTANIGITLKYMQTDVMVHVSIEHPHT